MQIQGAVALVTGSNRGVGASFVEALRARGATKIYAAARDCALLSEIVETAAGQIVPVQLDVTNPDDIVRAVQACPDVSLLVSNAGLECPHAIIAAPDETPFRAVMEVNYFGPLMLSRAFAPALVQSKGALAYVLSMAGLINVARSAAYSASKAACMHMAQGVRAELEPQGVGVTIAYPGFIETRMSSAFGFPKASPRQIADRILDAVEARQPSAFTDVFSEMTRDAFGEQGARVIDQPHATLARLVADFLKRPDAGR